MKLYFVLGISSVMVGSSFFEYGLFIPFEGDINSSINNSRVLVGFIQMILGSLLIYESLVKNHD